MTNLTVSITEDTKALLQRLTRAPLRSVATTGGRVDRVAGAYFRVALLLVESDASFLVGAEAVDLGGDEVFRITVFPFEAERHRHQPQFSPITGVASGLDLSVVIGSLVSAKIFRPRVEYYGDGELASAEVDAVLVIEGTEGGLLIDARCDDFRPSEVPVMPIDLVVTTTPSAIESRVAGLDASFSTGHAS